jgi:hypothetical protein
MFPQLNVQHIYTLSYLSESGFCDVVHGWETRDSEARAIRFILDRRKCGRQGNLRDGRKPRIKGSHWIESIALVEVTWMHSTSD